MFDYDCPRCGERTDYSGTAEQVERVFALPDADLPVCVICAFDEEAGD